MRPASNRAAAADGLCELPMDSRPAPMETTVTLQQTDARDERERTRRLPRGTHTDPRLPASVFAGGALGAGARAGLSALLPASAGSWPWAIFLLNAGGAILLAFFATRLQERLPPAIYKRPFVGTGICGALTTFSTLQLELVEMGRHGHYLLALAYGAASVSAGLAGVFATTGLTRRARLAR